jgi:hypothetical protein
MIKSIWLPVWVVSAHQWDVVGEGGGGGEKGPSSSNRWKRSVMVDSGRESKRTMTSLSKPHQLQLLEPYRPRLNLLHIHLAHAPKLRACHSVGKRAFCSHIPFTDTSKCRMLLQQFSAHSSNVQCSLRNVFGLFAPSRGSSFMVCFMFRFNLLHQRCPLQI